MLLLDGPMLGFGPGLGGFETGAKRETKKSRVFSEFYETTWRKQDSGKRNFLLPVSWLVLLNKSTVDHHFHPFHEGVEGSGNESKGLPG